MKIYFFRHAEKASVLSTDPDLTSRGFLQAKALTELVKTSRLPAPQYLYSSPRLRAINSMKDLSNSLNIPLKIEDELLERKGSENPKSFKERIRKFLTHLENKNHDVYICSHYDWVIECMEILPSNINPNDIQFQHWLPLQYVGFEYDASLYKIIETGQILA